MFKKVLLAITALLVTNACGVNTSWKYLAENLPGKEPVVFARDKISTDKHEHSAPAISPNGDEIYWSVFENVDTDDPHQVIYFVKYKNKMWSQPQVASFSGKYSDGGPCFAQAGNRIYFYSRRPLSASETELKDDVWYVERSNLGWSIPKNVGLSYLSNRDKWIFSPSVSDGGDVYITGEINGVHGLYMFSENAGGFTKPVLLPESINSNYDNFNWTPFIAPDGSYLIFSSKRNDSKGFNDLYISFRRRNGGWSDPENMGDKINNGQQVRFPRISPDGKYLFFTRKGDNDFHDVFWMSSDIIAVLMKHPS